MITHDDFVNVSKQFKKSPVTLVKNMINKKFTFTILIHIWFLRQHKFGELATIKTMNTKTLTLTLRDMIKHELIRKKTYQTSPKITKYFITKKGKELVRVYMTMINFAMQNYSMQIMVEGKPKQLEDVFSAEIMKLVQSQLI